MLLRSSGTLAALLVIVPIALSTSACSDDSGGDGDDDGSGGSSSGNGGAGVGGSSGTTLPNDQEPADQAGITAAHNVVRASVQPAPATPMQPLVWSNQLAAIAKAHADKCIWEHSMGDTGENLYASTGFMPTPQEVVQSWADEVADYDYASNECNGEQCGHYTQVVWANTAAVGCWQETCTTGSPFNNGGPGEWVNWVCEYDPPGNYIGQKPY